MKRRANSLIALTLALGGALAAPSTLAAQRGVDSDQFLHERAQCNRLPQDSQACLREAGAAREASRRGTLTHPADEYVQNALARCGLQPPADRLACEARVRGTGMTSVEGSVLGGGVIRETVTPIAPPLR